MKIHVVRNGDILWQVVQQYGAALNQVILANDISDPSALVVGQTLIIPEPGKEYVVQAGDNLWRISSDVGVSIQELSRLNNITDPNTLHVGEVLQIPNTTHTVQPGETLWVIANQYGVTINQMVQTNSITNPAAISAGQILHIPFAARPVVEVNAYITQLNEQGAGEVYTLGRNFTYLSPFMHSVREDGTVTEMQDGPILEAAHANNAALLFVITNFQNSNFDSDLAAAILRHSASQDKLITNIIDTMRAKGYEGLNIDFEYVYPEDRENYNAFLRKVVSRLHPEGFSVSTALAPKESDEQQGLLYEAHDYEEQGKIVDFIILMTYEWGWAGGEPWAIAPINKVRDVMDYAVTVIPPEKIVMGAPLYGRDWKIPWVEGTNARTISPEQGVALARRYREAIEYNETYQAPFFHYTDEDSQQHEVWFEDARSMQAKYDVVKEYGLRGISYWVLGNPFPQNWAVLRDNFKIRKL